MRASVCSMRVSRHTTRRMMNSMSTQFVLCSAGCCFVFTFFLFHNRYRSSNLNISMLRTADTNENNSNNSNKLLTPILVSVARNALMPGVGEKDSTQYTPKSILLKIIESHSLSAQSYVVACLFVYWLKLDIWLSKHFDRMIRLFHALKIKSKQ